MATFTLTTPLASVEAIYGTGVLWIDTPQLVTLLKVVEKGREAGALRRVIYEPQAPPAPPGTFLYVVEHPDGRLWRQTLTIAPGADPRMTFAVTDPWTAPEVLAQRDLLQALLTLQKDVQLSVCRVTLA